MTKEQFLSGIPFTIGKPTYKGTSTYYCNNHGESISRQYRSSINESVVLDDYECNISKITKNSFTGITFVMNKKIVVRCKFVDLIEFEDQGPQYDGAGFSIEDREDDDEELTHHCDDPCCNCSI